MTDPVKPSRYVPPGDGSMRDSILDALATTSGEERLSLALYFTVEALDMLGQSAITPAAKRVGLGTADALRPEIRGDTLKFIEDCKSALAGEDN